MNVQFSWKSGPILGKASESSTLSPLDPYKELREINFIHLTLQLEGKKNIIFYQRWKIVFMTGFLLLWLPGYQTSNGHSKYSTFTERVGRADSDCLFTGGKSQWYWDCCDQQLQLHQHRDMRRQTLVLLFSLTSVLLQQKIREILNIILLILLITRKQLKIIQTGPLQFGFIWTELYNSQLYDRWELGTFLFIIWTITIII